MKPAREGYRCPHCHDECRPLLDVLGVERGLISGTLARLLVLLAIVAPGAIGIERIPDATLIGEDAWTLAPGGGTAQLVRIGESVIRLYGEQVTPGSYHGAAANLGKSSPRSLELQVEDFRQLSYFRLIQRAHILPFQK